MFVALLDELKHKHGLDGAGTIGKMQDGSGKATTRRWLQNMGIIVDTATEQSFGMWRLIAEPFVPTIA